ncbi:MAG: M50 family metallopeptidase [Polyangiaceae bacterium]
MTLGRILLAIFGVAFLMIVHETGHFLAARRFGMRVLTFSIGFGPALWKYKPKNSPTTFQVGLIPFIAYVKVAGMNPFEEVDPNDKGSYANGSLWARIVTIFAGPLANYLFATVFIFVALVGWGKRELDVRSGSEGVGVHVSPEPGGLAAQAGMQKNDWIVAINGKPIPNWPELSKAVSSHPNEELDVELERDGKPVHIRPRVASTGRIGVHSISKSVPVGVGEAAIASLKQPPLVVAGTVVGLARMITGKEPPDVQGVKGIVTEVAKAFEDGPGDGLQFLGRLSAYLGGFNLLPLPALDGGRLMFLLYEAIARRRANEKTEAMIHSVGLLMFLAVMLVVTVREFLPSK